MLPSVSTVRPKRYDPAVLHVRDVGMDCHRALAEEIGQHLYVLTGRQ